MLTMGEEEGLCVSKEKIGGEGRKGENRREEKTWELPRMCEEKGLAFASGRRRWGSSSGCLCIVGGKEGRELLFFEFNEEEAKWGERASVIRVRHGIWNWMREKASMGKKKLSQNSSMCQKAFSPGEHNKQKKNWIKQTKIITCRQHVYCVCISQNEKNFV